MLVRLLLDLVATQLRELLSNVLLDRIDKLLPLLDATYSEGRTVETALLVRGLGKPPNKPDEDLRFGPVVERLGDYNTCPVPRNRRAVVPATDIE